MRNVPKISFLVSAYDRPKELEICLRSLKLQQGISFEILVAINSTGRDFQLNQAVCNELGVQSFATARYCKECYSSGNWLAKRATGEFICFPSDDNYYVPKFGQKLYDFAKSFRLKLVYCDCIYDDRYTGSYEVMRVQPLIGHIDKGGFILRRDHFPGFPKVPKVAEPAFCDGLLIEKLRAEHKIQYGKIHDILWFHN